MSYLLQYATGRLAEARAATFGARIDERTRLNLPGFYGDAFVRVYVEDTSARRVRRRPPTPHLRLRVADCTNEIALEFDLETAELRDNSLYKIDTLLAALHRFRDGLAAEAELYAQRERLLQTRTRRKEEPCRT
jgi:hypothetical protein